MVKIRKMEEYVEVIFCDKEELQCKMNECIKKMKETNWHIKDHNFVICDFGTFDIICTIIFEREVL